MNPIRTLLLSALLSTPVLAQQPPMPPAPVEVASASLDQLAPVLWSPASVVSRNDARIAAEQEGRVVFLAEIGDQVAKGGVLAKLDDQLLRLAVDEARAAQGRIAARLQYARAQQQRLAQLAQQGTVSNAQAEEAGAEQGVLEQELRGAEVALRQAQHRLSRAVLRAPFAGTVAERLIAVGEYLGPASPVVRLVDTTQLEVQARAPVNLAGFVSAGSEVSVRNAGIESRQTVRAVVPVGDASSRQFELRVALDQLSWPIGAALEVGLPSAQPKQVVTVPRDAVVLRPGERFVMRINADDTAERIAISTGGNVADRIEIIGAVNAGDRLVIRGAERLQPGQKVSIAPLPGSADIAAGSR